jgi:peptide/nickel transport system ATP-binding protein
MLEVNDLSVVFGSGHRKLTAVDSVSLAVPRGGTLGLVGESGSGKSTIARALVGLTPISGGTITLDGRDVTPAPERNSRAYRSRVQMVFQDPYSSLNPRMTIGATMVEAVSVQHEKGSRASRRAEVLRALELVGLGASALDRFPHQFSGGQRQRIAIARALAVHPDVVIMDEVTSALDVSVQATIINLLKELQQELGLSYLFISHDLSVIGAMSDVVAVMYLARVVESAEPESLFSNPCHPYTRGLIASVPDFGTTRRSAPIAGQIPDPRKPPSGCRFHTRCPIGPLTHEDRSICTTDDPQALAAHQPHRAACHFVDQDVVVAQLGASAQSMPRVVPN